RHQLTGVSMSEQIGLVPPQATDLGAEEMAAVEKLQRAYHNMKAELGKVIVGQEVVIEELLIALFCKGHALLVGVPGLAKTLLISTLSKTLGLSFNRIQFTPDLMPSDITGTEVIEEDKTTGGRAMRFVRGPVFANVILADEINLQHVLSGEEVMQLQDIVRKVPVADHVIRYALQFSRLTRKTETGGVVPDFVRDYVAWGAGPRASQYLILAAKARALLKGRYHVSTDDIRQVALPVLRHRIVTNFNAEAEGMKSDAIVKKLIESIPRQQYDELDASAARLMRGQSV